jgi:hypothetical protein
VIEQCEAQLRTNLTSDRVVAKLRRRASNIGESSRGYSKGLASGFVTENFLLQDVQASAECIVGSLFEGLVGPLALDSLSRRASAPSKGNCCLLRARDERENGLKSAEPDSPTQRQGCNVQSLWIKMRPSVGA